MKKKGIKVMKKKIPKFKSESEERRFWEKNDSSEYINWDEAKLVVCLN